METARPDRFRDPRAAVSPLLSRVLAPRGSTTVHDITAAPAAREVTRPPSATAG